MSELSPKQIAAGIVAALFVTIWLGMLTTCMSHDTDAWAKRDVEIEKAKHAKEAKAP